MIGLRWLGPALLGLAACDRSERPAVDHVVLILVDTLRADHLSAYGYARATSPVLDRFAAEGVLFENAISQCSWTSPSVVSLFTGQYIAEERLSMPLDRPAIAEEFQKAGFETAAFISNNIINEKDHFARGFDVFLQIHPYGENDRVLSWIESSKDRRTFTYVHLSEPHHPYQPPHEGDWRWRKAPGELDAERRAFYDQARRDLNLPASAEDEQAIAAEIGGYDDDVRVADRSIGELLDGLTRAGIAERTAVIVTADHGEGLWTRLAYMTGQRLEARDLDQAPTLVNSLMNTHGNQGNTEQIHVPLLMRAPGLPTGKRISAWVENVDIAPTLFELADLPVPAGLHGASLVPLARGTLSAKEFVFSQTRHVSSVITQDGLHLIEPTELGRCDFGLETELYDTQRDPRERKNLALERPDDVERLRALVAQRLEIGIPGEDLPLTDEQRATLDALGYTGGTVSIQSSETHVESDLPAEKLLALLFDPRNNCLVRRKAAQELGRHAASFDDVTRQRLKPLAEREVSPSVRVLLESLARN